MTGDVEYNGLEVESERQPQSKKKRVSNAQKWIGAVLVLLLVIVATVLVTKAVIDSHDTSSSHPDDDAHPKNLIIIIGDGMGQTYNAAYRKYKNITRTTLDQHFKGLSVATIIHLKLSPVDDLSLSSV